MGFVTNEKTALATPCTCYKLDGELICWSKGIIGTMTDEQESTYCTSKDIKPATGELKDRINKFTEAIHSAQEKYETEITPPPGEWQRLVGIELRERGIEI